MKFCSKFSSQTSSHFHSPSPTQQANRSNPKRSVLRTAVAGSILPLLLCAAGAKSAEFNGIGFLPDKTTSRATAVSGDGKTIVGYGYNNLGSDNQAFYWTKNGDMTPLVMPSGNISQAFGVNSDGSIIVGKDGTFRSFRWTDDDANGPSFTDLGTLSGIGGKLIAKGVSDDGSVVIGQNQKSSITGSRFDAFRWTMETGATLLGFLPDVGASNFFAGATAVSTDGAFIVGDSRTGTGGLEAVRWTEGGIASLGALPNANSPSSAATAVSSNGAFVVGNSSSDSGQQAFMWSQATNEMIGLGDLLGGDFSSQATGISADGSIVVGTSRDAASDTAFIWDAINQMRSLKTLLLEEGVHNVAGWDLRVTTGVSDNGTVITGWGTNPEGKEEGWVARIDLTDTDGDGVPDSADSCPNDPLNDADGDGVCGDIDSCSYGDETDSDYDGLADACDVCPADVANDADDDGVCGSSDNCPLTANADQSDNDDDDQGNTCDADDDNDGHQDAADNCPLQANDQTDSDGDGAGDACDADADADNVVDAEDACLLSPTGETANASGCAVADLCPCTHADSGKTWKNHGAYVKCVAHTTNDFVDAGLLTQAEKDAIQSAAGASSCGKKNKK